MRTLTVALCLVAASNAVVQAQGSTLEIIAAYYGTPDRFVDVTGRVRSLPSFGPGGVSIPISPDTFGVQGSGIRVLRVYYRLDNRFHHGEWRDGETVLIGTAVAATATTTSNSGSGLRILGAIYGAGNRTVDVTNALRAKVVNNRIDLQITNQNLRGPDPAPAVVKELRVAYEYQGQRKEARVDENGFLRLPDASVPLDGLYILSAHWGAPGKMANVTGAVAGLVTNNRLDITVGNATLGVDPARGADKTLQLVYQYNGQRFETVVGEDKVLSIPPKATSAVASNVPESDGACFYNEANFRGMSQCFAAGDAAAQMSASSFGSIRLNGRVRQVEIYEGPRFSGRFIRIQANQPDLRQAAGGSVSAPNFWITKPGSVRISY